MSTFKFCVLLLLLQLLAGSSDAHLRNVLKDDVSGAEYKASDGSKLFGTKKLPWKNLEYLDIRSNLLEGPVPAPSPNMKVFLIANNRFTGEIPSLICNTSNIEVVDLSNNSLTGTIPECFGNFSNTLRVLDLRKNKFRGTLPATFSNGSNFRTLNFNGNELEGSVPKSLLNCTNLEVLDLGNNKINDSFPYWLGSLPKLQVLVLRSNKFHGHVRDYEAAYPFSNLRIFDLSNNNFTGSFPAKYFENLKAMMDVGEAASERKSTYMGETYYEDSVTLTVKGFEIKLVKILTIFTTIDFSNNKFVGEIPEHVGNLLSLRLLNLSRNLISGNIPESMGNLKQLESLDLSSNKLEGEIPKQLARLTFLAILKLAGNNLSGPIPGGSQFATFSNDSYSGNLELCGFPLSKSCHIYETPQTPLRSEDDFLEPGIGFGWKVVLMGYGCGVVFGMIFGFIVFSTGKPRWLARIVEGGYHGNVRRQKKKPRARRNEFK